MSRRPTPSGFAHCIFMVKSVMAPTQLPMSPLQVPVGRFALTVVNALFWGKQIKPHQKIERWADLWP